MPPKKKKGGKKSGKKKGASKTTSKAGVNIDNALNEVSKQFYLIQIKDLEQKIARYQEKCDRLELLNNEVQENFDQQATDKLEITTYLKRQLEQKSIEIIGLQEQLNALELCRKSEQENCILEVATIKTDMIHMQDRLTSENTILGGKLASLEEFRQQREELMNRSAEMEEELKTQEINHKEQIYQLERKAVIDMDRLKKEMFTRVNTVAAEFRMVSKKQMADTTKRAISENVKINSTLAKISDKTMELISENDGMKTNEKTQRQSIEMLEENEKELVKKNAMHTKLIMMLTQKAREQEQCLEEFAERELKYNELEKEFQSLTHSLENLKSSELSLKNEREKLSKKCELYENERDELNHEKLYLICVLADAADAIKHALQHENEDDPATIEMKTTNLLNNVVEILNVAAELGVGVNPEQLASARKAHYKKKKQVYLGPLNSKHATLYDEICSKPVPHYTLGDLGIVPPPTRVQKPPGKFPSKTANGICGIYSHGSRSSMSSSSAKRDIVKLPLLTPNS